MTGEQVKAIPTVETLPRRRGVVMRSDGISDSYGRKYTREIGSGTLRRAEPKMKSR
jgi:hypothetical protein